MPLDPLLEALCVFKKSMQPQWNAIPRMMTGTVPFNCAGIHSNVLAPT